MSAVSHMLICANHRSAKLYAIILAVLAVWSRTWSSIAASYHTAILLLIFAVYAYRDLWPLATYTEFPQDDTDDPIFWIKLVIIAICALGVPLFIPHKYIPVDPKVSVCTASIWLINHSVCPIFVEPHADGEPRANLLMG